MPLAEQETGGGAELPDRLMRLAEEDARDLDAATGRWMEEYREAGRRIYCGKGCSGCCTLAVNCTFPEALRIAGSLDPARIRRVVKSGELLRDRVASLPDLKSYLRMHREEMGGCPLLERDGSCSVYPLRPLSCRSLLSTLEPRWCTTDFGTLSTAERRRFIAGLDASAVAFPTHYAAFPQGCAAEREEKAERLMKEELGFSLAGNVRFLLYLELEHRISSVISRGFDSTATWLLSRGLLLPFVLDLK